MSPVGNGDAAVRVVAAQALGTLHSFDAMPALLKLAADDLGYRRLVTATRAELVKLLADAGFETLTAGTVPDAMRFLSTAQPHLLITEIRLDTYNGLHLIAMAPKPIPAIVITGYPDRAVEADARRLGAELAVTGTVHKVSNLILNMTISVKDAQSGRALSVVNADLRGNSGLMRAWRLFADATAYLLLFITISGVYLWVAGRRERRVGWVVLGAAAVVSVVLMLLVTFAG